MGKNADAHFTKKQKAAKGGQRTRSASKAKGDEDKKTCGGCISPTKCLIGVPIDPANPGDAVKVTCSNGAKCDQILFIHAVCFEAFEDELLRIFNSHAGQSRRGSTWPEQQKRANLWNKKGYEVLYSVCRCPCSGFIRKDIDYRPVGAAQADTPEQKAEKKKKKKSKAAEKPQLDRPWGYKLTTQTLLDSDPRQAIQDAFAASKAEREQRDACIPGYNPPENIKPDKKSQTSSAPSPKTPSKPETKVQQVEVTGGAVGFGGRQSRRESFENPSKGGAVEEDEIQTVEQLISVMKTLLPNGTYPKSDVEDSVNYVLAHTTVDLLSMISDAGGFWDWICAKENGLEIPFKLVLENETVTKAALPKKKKKKASAAAGGDGDDVQQSATKREDPTASSGNIPISEVSPLSSKTPMEPPQEKFTIDPEVRRLAEAHAELSPDFQYAGSIYSRALNEMRKVSRELGAKTYWPVGSL